jgi:hypothetical protein
MINCDEWWTTENIKSLIFIFRCVWVWYRCFTFNILSSSRPDHYSAFQSRLMCIDQSLQLKKIEPSACFKDVWLRKNDNHFSFEIFSFSVKNVVDLVPFENWNSWRAKFWWCSFLDRRKDFNENIATNSCFLLSSIHIKCINIFRKID